MNDRQLIVYARITTAWGELQAMIAANQKRRDEGFAQAYDEDMLREPLNGINEYEIKKALGWI